MDIDKEIQQLESSYSTSSSSSSISSNKKLLIRIGVSFLLSSIFIYLLKPQFILKTKILDGKLTNQILWMRFIILTIIFSVGLYFLSSKFF